MSKYMAEAMKPHFKLQQKGFARCTACKRKTGGNFLIFQDRYTKAIDGSMAARIFFACLDKNHLTSIGYNKPVDFSLNLPKHGLDDRTFEEEEGEIENEWKEMEENAMLRRRTL